MTQYEAIYIIDTAMEEAARSELIARFNELIAANGGTLDKVDEWGKRRLAYTIDYKNEGYYVLLHFSAGPNLPRELERNLQNNENILRYLVVKLEQKRSSVKPRAVPLRPAPPIEPAIAAEAEPAVEAGPVTEVEPTAEAEPVIEAEPAAETEPDFEAEPVVEAEPAIEAEPVVEAEEAEADE